VNEMNIIAITFWIFCSAVGFAAGGWAGLAIGLAVGTGLSLVGEMVASFKMRNRVK